jgi:uncharacterized protein
MQSGMQKQSSSSVEVKSIDKRAVRDAVDRFAVRLLASDNDVEEIVVFGSFETDTYSPGSDIDLLIVLRDSKMPPRERIPAFLPEKFPVPVDVFPFTRAELDEMSDSPVVKAVNRSQWRYGRNTGNT